MSAISTTFTAPVEIVGTKLFLEETFDSDPGNPQEIHNFTVGVGKIRKIYAVIVDCRVPSRSKIFAGTTLIGSCRTGTALPNGSYLYYLPYELVAGDVFKIEFESQASSAIGEVSVHVQLTEQDS